MADPGPILRAADVAWREIDGQVVLLDGDVSKYLALNRTGSELWSRMTEGASRDALVRALVERFEVDDETAVADVDRFVALLDSHGLLASRGE